METAEPRVGPRLSVRLREQNLVQNRSGYAVWQVEETQRVLDAPKTALLLCDVWNRHTCRGAEERLERLLPRMQQVVTAMRRRGALIVHAPSDTMDFYAGTPARERVLDCPRIATPEDLAHDDPVLPVDQADPCDTCPDEEHPVFETGMPWPWTRQHPAIEIDQARDVISCQGAELWSYYRYRGIEQVLIMGVHTGMCILRRTFSIKQMTRWGLPIALIRDLTDALYHPSKPPYVSHEEGTRLIVEYIEKFWCPTLTSDDLVVER
jgi:nicotinamidase-related amidase